ncbi:MAG: PaaI family thioesterase [Psychromonas sp.]
MSIAKKIYRRLPESIRDTLLLRMFGLFKVPLLFWIRPKIVELSKQRTIIKIPLGRRTKNHLNSMYFGVLASGADCAGALSAMKMINESGHNVSLAFKDFHADFLKRAEGDTLFTCTQGEEIKLFVERVLASEQRQHMPVKVIATCPDKTGDEPVAIFTLTLSLKKKLDN